MRPASGNTKPSRARLGERGFRDTTIGSVQPQKPPVALVSRRALGSSSCRKIVTVIMIVPF